MAKDIPKSNGYVQLHSDAESEEAYRFIDAQKRKVLRKKWHINGLKPKERARHRRAVEKIIRREKKYDQRRARLTRDELVMLLRDKRSSLVMDHLFPDRNRPGRWIKYEDRRMAADGEPFDIDLSGFSLLDNPHGCIQGLANIAEHEASSSSVQINFKDKYCLDVVPYMLLTEFWNDMLPVFQGGEMDVPMQKVLGSIGIAEDLNVGLRGVRDFDDVWAFPLTRRRRDGGSKSRSIYFDVPSRDHASDRFCDALDEWLNRDEIQLQLTQAGRGHIKVLLGELLENAERHSDGNRRDGSWTVAGFLAKRRVYEDDEFIAHIGIVSLGDTFADSLERASDQQKQDLDDFLNCMRAARAPQSAATLKTLAALQDGVTCVPEADKADRGGYGLMQMLELTNLLGWSENDNLKPEITIVSGTSCVQLKSPYFECYQPAGADTARVQWCNADNSARMAPDPNHVFDLEKGLPGTAISIRFTLDPQYLQKMMDNLEQ
ncbi:hypothetical protein N6L27_04215 [Leisingera sp. SS27]|uniref:hypothetical protein n=1 Tax=Leisingera sp. SS27 TaxID=2979462 RepID=UPI00232A99D4|nr:hypothetical protein [Leisingera sp. SS27]MDC0657195.1 hypothetical protein [Leisingera sp. SS27]